MADPLSWFGLVMSFGFGATSYDQGKKSQKEQAKANKAQIESAIEQFGLNKELAELDIARTKEDLEYNVGVFQEGAATFRREQAAAQGAAGAEMGSGTPLAVMSQTLRRQEQDRLALIAGYEAQIEGLEMQKEYYTSEEERYKTLFEELYGFETKAKEAAESGAKAAKNLKSGF